jgi:ribosomal protein S14
LKITNLKELNQRKLVKIFEKENTVIRALTRNQILDQGLRANVQMPVPAFETKIHNHCTITARSRSIEKSLGISHKEFRRMVEKGILPG